MFPLGTVLFPSALPAAARLRGALPGPGARLPGRRPRVRRGAIERGSEVGGGDLRTTVGTVARIIEAVELDDGRWALGTVGVRRVRVARWLDDDPYPRAEVEDWPDERRQPRDRASGAAGGRPAAPGAGHGRRAGRPGGRRHGGAGRRPRAGQLPDGGGGARSGPPTSSGCWPTGSSVAAAGRRSTSLLAEPRRSRTTAAPAGPSSTATWTRRSMLAPSPAVGIHLPNPFVGPPRGAPWPSPPRRASPRSSRSSSTCSRRTPNRRRVDPLKALGTYLAWGAAGAVLLAAGLFFVALSALRALQTETGTDLRGQLVVGPLPHRGGGPHGASSAWPPGGSPTAGAEHAGSALMADERHRRRPQPAPSPSAATTSRPSSASCRARSRSSARRPAATASPRPSWSAWPSWASPSCSVAAAAGATARSSRCVASDAGLPAGQGPQPGLPGRQPAVAGHRRGGVDPPASSSGSPGPRPAVIYRDRLGPGQSVVIRHHEPPPNRRQRTPAPPTVAAAASAERRQAA